MSPEPPATERGHWLKQEFERARKRNEQIPAHARMVVTNPALSAHSRTEAPMRSTDPLAEVERLLDEHAVCGYLISQTGLDYWVTYECGVTVQVGRSMADAERAHIAKVLASDWLAAHDARVRADERQKVAALLADESTVEKVERALEMHVWPRSNEEKAHAAIDAIAGIVGDN